MVFNGRRQKYRISHSASSPTPSFTTLTTALACAARSQYHYFTCDITSAFLYAALPNGVELFCEIPEGHPAWSQRENMVLRINRNLYGLREAPLLWWSHLDRELRTHLRVQPATFDECCYVGPDIILLCYVDDILVLGTPAQLEHARKKLRKLFKLTETSINASVDFLGCTIERTPDANFLLHQNRYTRQILETVRNTVKQVTPLPTTVHRMLVDNRERALSSQEATAYRRKLGELGFLRLTRADICHALGVLAQQNINPTALSARLMQHTLA